MLSDTHIIHFKRNDFFKAAMRITSINSFKGKYYTQSILGDFFFF